MTHLGSTIARLKLKGIDGGPHKRWSMWFNSMIREEPYQGLNVSCIDQRWSFLRTTYKVLHGCRQLAVRCQVKSYNDATPTVSCQHVKMGTLAGLPVQTERKVGMTSNHHGPYVLGYTRATMVGTEGSHCVSRSESLKPISVRIGVCNSTP